MTPIERNSFERCGPTISEEDIRALEQTIGARLPDDYRAFLLTFNGGRPTVRDTFDMGNDSSIVDLLFSVRHEDPAKTVANELSAFEGRIPAALVPIGHDPGGSLICINVGEKDYGKVHLWDIEDEYDQPTYRNVYPIAESFARFLESLYAD